MKLSKIYVSTDDHGGDVTLACPDCEVFCEMPATDEIQGTVLTMAMLVEFAGNHVCGEDDE